MLDLLKWRTHPDKITGCLSKIKEIDGSEIVKVYGVSLSLSWEIHGIKNIWRGRADDIFFINLFLYLTVSARYTGYIIWNFR